MPAFARSCLRSGLVSENPFCFFAVWLFNEHDPHVDNILDSTSIPTRTPRLKNNVSVSSFPVTSNVSQARRRDIELQNCTLAARRPLRERVDPDRLTLAGKRSLRAAVIYARYYGPVAIAYKKLIGNVRLCPKSG